MKKIKIEVTADELTRICSHLTGSLTSNIHFGFNEAGVPAIVAEWRRSRVEFLAYKPSMKDFSPEELKEQQAEFDIDANLLERLSPLIDGDTEASA